MFQKNQKDLLLDWMSRFQGNGKIKDDSQVFGLHNWVAFGVTYWNGNIVGEKSSFALINSDMPITYPKQYAKMAVEYVSLDAQKIGWIQ